MVQPKHYNHEQRGERFNSQCRIGSSEVGDAGVASAAPSIRRRGWSSRNSTAQHQQYTDAGVAHQWPSRRRRDGGRHTTRSSTTRPPPIHHRGSQKNRTAPGLRPWRHPAVEGAVDSTSSNNSRHREHHALTTILSNQEPRRRNSRSASATKPWLGFPNWGGQERDQGLNRFWQEVDQEKLEPHRWLSAPEVAGAGREQAETRRSFRSERGCHGRHSEGKVGEEEQREEAKQRRPTAVPDAADNGRSGGSITGGACEVGNEVRNQERNRSGTYASAWDWMNSWARTIHGQITRSCIR
jgi:hypothetical protein